MTELEGELGTKRARGAISKEVGRELGGERGR
jgi:hypothetical protein